MVRAETPTGARSLCRDGVSISNQICCPPTHSGSRRLSLTTTHRKRWAGNDEEARIDLASARPVRGRIRRLRIRHGATRVPRPRRSRRSRPGSRRTPVRNRPPARRTNHALRSRPMQPHRSHPSGDLHVQRRWPAGRRPFSPRPKSRSQRSTQPAAAPSSGSDKRSATRDLSRTERAADSSTAAITP